MTLSPIRLDIDALSALPLDIDDFKVHLGIDGVDDDALIESKALAAIAWAEDTAHRTIFQRAHRWVLRDFPQTRSQQIDLPRGKTAAVASIAYVSGGVTTTLNGPSSGSPAGNGYLEDLRGDDGGVIMPNQGETWPSVDCDHPAPVTITFTAGWADSEVPANLVQAIMVATQDAMDIRGVTDTRSGMIDVKKALLRPFLLTRFYEP